MRNRCKKQADIVDEQIDTIGRAILGITIACARCHDHKFDPVPQKDYYALAGIFHSTTIQNAQGLESAKEKEAKAIQKKALPSLKSALAAKDKQLADLIDLPHEQHWQAEDFARGNVIIDRENYGKEIGIIGDPGSQKNWVEYDLTVTTNGPHLLHLRYAALESRPGKILLDGDIVADPAIAATTGGWMPEHQQWIHEATLKLAPGKHTLRVESEPMMSHIDQLKLSPITDPEAAKELMAEREKLKKALTETQQALAKDPELKVMSVHDGTVAHAKLNRRGNPHDLGSEVPRGALTQFGPAAAPSPPETSGRLELAEWLTRPGHPLTTRVLVNRVWRWHFGGKALVDSPDDFGTRGGTPTHPKLLDYLALSFERDGWSLKALHRRILCSQTWQMSGHHPNAEAMAEIDPENTAYWKTEPRRLEAEAFRDAVLTVAGSLERSAPQTPPVSVKSQDPSPEDLMKNRTAYENDPHRSVYLPVVRCHLYDLFTLLDFPNASAPVGERNETTVPTQALLMLNNPWLTKQAGFLAKRVDGDLEALYQHLYGRSPSEGERHEAHDFITRYQRVNDSSTAAWTALCQTLIISNEFLYVR